MCNFTTTKKRKTEKKTKHILSIVIIAAVDQVFETEEGSMTDSVMHRIEELADHSHRRKGASYVTRSAVDQPIIANKKETIRERNSKQTDHMYVIGRITKKLCSDTFTSMKATAQTK